MIFILQIQVLKIQPSFSKIELNLTIKPSFCHKNLSSGKNFSQPSPFILGRI